MKFRKTSQRQKEGSSILREGKLLRYKSQGVFTKCGQSKLRCCLWIHNVKQTGLTSTLEFELRISLCLALNFQYHILKTGFSGLFISTALQASLGVIELLESLYST